MLFHEPLMKKRMTMMVIALLVVFGGIIAFNLIKSFMIKHYFAHFEFPAVTVSSVVAKQQNWDPRIAAVGNFVAMNGVDVNSQASGSIVAIHFNSGQFIKKDQPLVDIDDSVEQATLKYNQADLTLKEINYKRQVDLSKRGATSASSVDEAKAKLLQAQANVENTQALIRQKHITTPFTGQLGIRKVDLGQYVTPGQTAIVSLQLMDPMYLEFYLPEQRLKQLSINQTVTFSVEQNPHLRFQGKISAINSRIDTNTHTIQVQATLPNCPAASLKDPSHSPLIKLQQPNNADPIVICDSALNTKHQILQFNFMPGMFASIEVDQPAIPNVVVLPSTAISYTLYGNSIFIIEKDKKPDDQGNDIFRVKRVFVTTGEQHGNNTIITKGIKAGQLVVASGELKLQDGTRVIINNDVPLNPIENPDKMGQ